MLKKIKRLCVDRGIRSLSELENLSGVQPRSIYRWDRNRPSVDRAAKVAKVLNVTVDELLKPEK